MAVDTRYAPLVRTEDKMAIQKSTTTNKTTEEKRGKRNKQMSPETMRGGAIAITIVRAGRRNVLTIALRPGLPDDRKDLKC